MASVVTVGARVQFSLLKFAVTVKSIKKVRVLRQKVVCLPAQVDGSSKLMLEMSHVTTRSLKGTYVVHRL